MKKLNRSSLRTVLLREFKTLSEQSEARKALSKVTKKADAEYERAYKEGGITGLAFSIIIGLPLESIMSAGKLLMNPEVTQKLEKTYQSEGPEAVYVEWLDMLTKEIGL